MEGRLTELEAQAAAAEERSAALEAELQQARQGAEEARTASEKHVQVHLLSPCEQWVNSRVPGFGIDAHFAHKPKSCQIPQY